MDWPTPRDKSRGPVAIGVTGHRQFACTPSIEEEIGRALSEACERFGATRMVLYSALAEGADRLVAQRVLSSEEGQLVAVLPFDRNEYMEDFRSGESRIEFRDLLERARSIVVMERVGSRDAGYTAAGDYILDCSDVVIALWDGKEEAGEGGTAATVKAARRRGLPLIWLKVSRNRE